MFLVKFLEIWEMIMLFLFGFFILGGLSVLFVVHYIICSTLDNKNINHITCTSNTGAINGVLSETIKRTVAKGIYVLFSRRSNMYCYVFFKLHYLGCFLYLLVILNDTYIH